MKKTEEEKWAVAPDNKTASRRIQSVPSTPVALLLSTKYQLHWCGLRKELQRRYSMFPTCAKKSTQEQAVDS